MADFATPAVERILQPVKVIPAHVVHVRVQTGESQTLAESKATPPTPVARLKHEIKKVYHRREPVIDIGQRFALDLRAHFLGNFAHLIHDVLAPCRFIEQVMAGDANVDLTPIHVILPKKAPTLALRVLEFAGVPTICTDGVVRGNLITFTQDHNVCLLPYLARQPFEPWPHPTAKKVLVLRRGSRALLNEKQITDFLIAEGFEPFYMEDIPLSQQWTLLRDAREVVGIHGAGLSSLGFSVQRPLDAGPRFRLTELFGPGFVNNCFRIYAAVLRGTWIGVRGKITPGVIQELDIRDRERAHEHAPFELDVESLAEALAYDYKART
jgi:glycosyl transferase family 61